jgi:hypothetical protein
MILTTKDLISVIEVVKFSSNHWNQAVGQANVCVILQVSDSLFMEVHNSMIRVWLWLG